LRATLTPMLALSALLLLQACAGTPPPPQETEPAPVPEDPNNIPELTLNLPGGEECVCVPEEPVDYTFLEKGFSALVAGEHIEAVQHFQRYQRLEASDRADWEAGIAIAYDSMLPRSPFYDPEAARKSYEKLRKSGPGGMQVHEKILMMRDSLETFVRMDRQIEDLESDNAILNEDLEKREEALKRLRALTLGQKGSRE
jgi:hypothetical protein